MRYAWSLRIALAFVLAAGFGSEVVAQAISAGFAGSRTTYDEVVADNRQNGFGAAIFGEYATEAWAAEGEVTWRSLSPTEPGPQGLTMLGVSFRGRYRAWETLFAEVGLERRSVDPEFTAQEVGFVSVGLRYESALTSRALVWIRGAAIPVTGFSGGGSGGVGVEVGFGARVQRADSPWAASAAYDFQRIDRTVSELDAPIQLSGLRVGIEYRVR